MEIFDFNVAAGAVFQVHYEGSYVYYASGSAGGADATVSLRHDASGDRVLLLPGQGFRLPDGAAARSWRISNYAGAAPILGRLVIGAGGIDDNRITGSVEVIDGGKNRALSGSCFYGLAYGGPVAGQYTHVQLWNPVGSGKNVFVEQVSFYAGGAAASGIVLRSHAASIGAIADGPQNKNLGSAVASVAQLRMVAQGITGDQFGVLMKAQPTLKFSEPMCVPPGRGLIINNNTPNEDLGGNFEWYEEAV